MGFDLGSVCKLKCLLVSRDKKKRLHRLKDKDVEKNTERGLEREREEQT